MNSMFEEWIKEGSITPIRASIVLPSVFLPRSCLKTRPYPLWSKKKHLKGCLNKRELKYNLGASKMVSILRALKITLFYFIPIILSLAVFIIGILILNIHYDVNGNLTIIKNVGLPLGLIGGGGFLFLLFMLKAIGDMAEEALTYYE